MSKINLENLTIAKIKKSFQSGEYSSFELVSAYLKAINNDKTNSFISINDQALILAKEADKKIKSGQASPLTGIPLAVKDLILVKDQKATAGSQMLAHYVATYTATAVQRLVDQGMIIIGKTNCDEFAMGASSETSYFGPVKNPHDLSRVAGGSSGGSAAALAANLAPLALGTDTGGSIRQPAAFCGVYGLKPSYGRVSRYGTMAMTSSLDQIGPMANSIEDLAYLLQYMAGHDKYDATSLLDTVPNYNKEIKKEAKELVLGVPQEYFGAGINPEIKTAIENKIAQLKEQGFKVKSVSLPYTEYALAAYYLLVPAEVSSNLARYDGLLYGLRGNKKNTLSQWYHQVRGQGFGAEVKRRIILGTYVLSAGYYDAYYKKAQKVRTLIKNDFAKVFKQVDVLVTPATPTTAFKIGEKSNDPLAMYMSDVFTVAANIAGICGLVLPLGKDSNKLPIGLQLLAAPLAESKLFRLGAYLEKAKN